MFSMHFLTKSNPNSWGVAFLALCVFFFEKQKLENVLIVDNKMCENPSRITLKVRLNQIMKVHYRHLGSFDQSPKQPL